MVEPTVTATTPVEMVPDDPLRKVEIPDHELTQIPITPRMRNILIGLGVLALVLLLWKASGVVTLLVAGAALAVVLSYPVRALTKVMPRGLAMLTVILGSLLLVVVALVVLIPIAAAQLGDLIARLPQFADQGNQLIERLIDYVASHGLLRGTPQETIDKLQNEMVGRANGVAEGVLGGAVASLTGALGTVFQVFSIILVAIYLLADSDRIRALYVRSFPLVYRDDALELWDDVGNNLSKYLAGVLVSISFQGIAATIVLSLLHVPYALLLGIWTSIAAIIPVIGSYFGAVPAVIAGFFVSPLTAVLVGVTYFVINMIDGNVIAPRVQGRALSVPPLLIFLAVIAGSQIAGIFGAILAVPGLAILRALWVFFDQRLVVSKDAHEAYATAKATANILVSGIAGRAEKQPAISVEVTSGTDGAETTRTVTVTKGGKPV